jgi:hypothetical protein
LDRFELFTKSERVNLNLNKKLKKHSVDVHDELWHVGHSHLNVIDPSNNNHHEDRRDIKVNILMVILENSVSVETTPRISKISEI